MLDTIFSQIKIYREIIIEAYYNEMEDVIIGDTDYVQKYYGIAENVFA